MLYVLTPFVPSLLDSDVVVLLGVGVGIMDSVVFDLRKCGNIDLYSVRKRRPPHIALTSPAHGVLHS